MRNEEVSHVLTCKQTAKCDPVDDNINKTESMEQEPQGDVKSSGKTNSVMCSG